MAATMVMLFSHLFPVSSCFILACAPLTQVDTLAFDVLPLEEVVRTSKECKEKLATKLGHSWA